MQVNKKRKREPKPKRPRFLDLPADMISDLDMDGLTGDDDSASAESSLDAVPRVVHLPPPEDSSTFEKLMYWQQRMSRFGKKPW